MTGGAAGVAPAKERGRGFPLDWFLRQVGLTKRQLLRLDETTMLLWAHSACAGDHVMKASIIRSGPESFSFSAVDTVSADGQAFTFGDFIVEGQRAVLLREANWEAGGECGAFALLARVVRAVNESPLDQDGRAVSAYFCYQPGEAAGN